MTEEHERFMRVALEEAAKAGAEGNMAVGSIIVRDGSVVARGRNLVSTTLDPTAHAETVALREAGPALGGVDYTGCTLYTTFEPCAMCCGALMTSGISTLVMGARHQATEDRQTDYTVERLLELARWSDKIELVTGILTRECAEIR